MFKACSVLFTIPIRKRKTKFTQRLDFIVRMADVANSHSPVLKQADAGRKVWPPFGPNRIRKLSYNGQQSEHVPGLCTNSSSRLDGTYETDG